MTSFEDEYLPKNGKPKKEIKKRDLTDVKFDKVWTIENRYQLFKEGIENSIDEIITSLHQPLELEVLDDTKYKNMVEGRVTGSNAVKSLMNELDEINKRLGNVTTVKFTERKDFKSGRAEEYARKKQNGT